MTNKRKTKRYLKLMVCFLCFFGLIANLSIGITTPYLIDKKIGLPNWLFIFLFILIFLSGFTLYVIFLIYPCVNRKENKLTRFINSHSGSFCFLFLLVMVVVMAIYNEKEYDKEKIANLINIEWVIFGISVGFFTIWHAIFSSKKTNVITNPNKLVGTDRISAINVIKGNIQDYNNIIFPIVLLVVNVLFLIISTSMFYILDTIDKVTVKCGIISFYLCTNTLLSVFLEVITPIIKAKIEYEEKYKNIKSDSDTNLLIQSIVEEAIIRFYDDSLKDLGDEEKSQVMNEIRNKMIELRSEDTNHPTK